MDAWYSPRLGTTVACEYLTICLGTVFLNLIYWGYNQSGKINAAPEMAVLKCQYVSFSSYVFLSNALHTLRKNMTKKEGFLQTNLSHVSQENTEMG